MSLSSSSLSALSTRTAPRVDSPKSAEASNSSCKRPEETRPPYLASQQSPEKPLHISDLNSDLKIVINSLLSGSSKPIVKARIRKESDEDNAQQLTPEMRSLFKNIQLGEPAFFDLVPGKRTERRTHGIDLDLVHPTKLHTPLTMALHHKQFNIAVSLLVLGADPLALDGHEKSPADYATPLCRMFIRFFNLRRQPVVRIENSEPRKRFLELLNAQDVVTGDTMLSWAVTQRMDKMAALLMADGADFSSRNAKGHAPLEVATRYGSVQIVNAMLDVWPQLATRPKLPYLKQAIMGTVELDRPALLASLLIFFLAEFRANEASEGSEGNDSIDQHEVILRNAQTEDEAFDFFMKAKLAPALTIQQLMLRTTNNILLTEHECWLLGLDKAEQRATEMGHQRVLEILAARTLPHG